MFTLSTILIICLGAAAVCWLLLPLAALGCSRDTCAPFWSWLIAAGSLALLIAAILALPAGSAITFSLPHPISLGGVAAVFRLDPLAAWFLAIIALVGICISPYLSGYMSHLRERADLRFFWIGFPLLLLSMGLVVLAANVQTFLIAWEVMSLTSFGLVATEHRPHATRSAALIYIGATRVGTGLLAGGFLWAHALAGSWAFSDWHLHGMEALGPGLLVLAGLGVKAGMWPFHLWLPIAHPAAPSPVSAVMSGVMVKVAIAVIVRLFLLDDAFIHPAFGYLLLVLGAIGAFWGILFALVQQNLKRLLALSTVENVGLILVGVGGGIAARHLGLGWVAEIALAAALFHALNHAFFKSLLFLGAGAVDSATGTLDLADLGGLSRRMPWTFACFTLGAAAICALPPFNGFASEWLLYQGSLAVGFGAEKALVRFFGMLMIGLIALVGALALAVFVKAVGVVFEGRARSVRAERAHEVGRGMRVSLVLMAVGCATLGLLAPDVLRLLQIVVAPIAPSAPPLASVWTIHLGAAVLIVLATMAAGAAWLSRVESRRPAREYGTWACGFGDLGVRAQVSGISFVQPIARLFASVLRYAQPLRIEGADRRLFPNRLSVDVATESVLEKRVYRAAARWLWRAGDRVLQFQEGSIHRYLMTMFLTLLALLAIGGYSR